jgi:SAM-dependent methyltransferase
MEMSATQRTAGAPSAHLVDEVVWHDLECGGYRADMALWRELGDLHPGPILEIGAGTGRVALALASEGREVTALEREPLLLDALRERPGGQALSAVCADARGFALGEGQFALCLVPMQTVQLFGGARGRAAFLRAARAALRPGGLLACALLGRVEPFDCAAGQAGPAPETLHIDGLLYCSHPTRVAVRAQSVVIERERRVWATAPQRPGPRRRAPRRAPLLVQRSVIELDRLGPRTLQREARGAGLRVAASRQVPATDDHAGSTVVMLRV